jgi:hypothetical protein
MQRRLRFALLTTPLPRLLVLVLAPLAGLRLDWAIGKF